jgi:hypothetical protein
MDETRIRKVGYQEGDPKAIDWKLFDQQRLTGFH